MKREIVTSQRKVRTLFFKIDTDGSVLQGSGHDGITCTRNGAGDYTVTLDTPGARLLDAGATPIDSETYPQIDESDSSASAVNFVFKDTDGTPTGTDTKFFGHITVSDDSLER
jgi:hypothetical protein